MLSDAPGEANGAGADHGCVGSRYRTINTKYDYLGAVIDADSNGSHKWHE